MNILIGALTAKPYCFNFRKWKLKTLETIDLFDSFGSNICIDIEGSYIKRILPYKNNKLNKEWITDKARFAYDGLNNWEFIHPSIKFSFMKFFFKISWYSALNYINKKIYEINYKYNNFFIKSGNFNDLETIIALKKYTNNFGNICLINNINILYDLPNNYLFNLNLKSIIGNKIIIIIGSNLRFENSILNLKLKKISIKSNILISYLGSSFNSTYLMNHLSNNIKYLLKIILGKNLFCNQIKKKNNKFFFNKKLNNKYKNSISLLFGSDFLNRIDSKEILNIFFKKKNFYNKYDYNLIHLYSGIINALELGYSKNKLINIIFNQNNNRDIYYLHDTDSLNSQENYKLKRNFIIFQGMITNKLLNYINLILPIPNILEKYGYYINYIGIIQRTKLIFLPKKTKRESWKILSIIIKKLLLYNKYNNNIIIDKNDLYIQLNFNSPILKKKKKFN